MVYILAEIKLMKLLFYRAIPPKIYEIRSRNIFWANGRLRTKLTKAFFALEPNGTLRTATVLDFETSPQIRIRVEVRDENNASMVKDFVVQVVDDLSDNSKEEEGVILFPLPGKIIRVNQLMIQKR